MITNFVPAFIFAVITGYLFEKTHIPLPWTLGPLASTVVWILLFKQPVYCPKLLRNLGLIILGYVMGSPFTPEIGLKVIGQLPLMFLATFTTVALCLFTGYATGKYSGVGIANSLIGSIPGGLSQMSVICEETKGTSPAVVTLMQTVRVVTVVFTIPFLTLHGLANSFHEVSRQTAAFYLTDLPRLALFLLVSISLIWFHKRFKLPSPFLIGPVVGTAALVLSGISAPALPSKIIALSQIFISIRMGKEACSTNIPNWRKVVWVNLVSVLSVIVGLLGVSYLFSRFTPITMATAFISMSPGGISEMGLTAMMIDADLPTVVSFQLLRLLFVLIVAIPALRWWLRKNGAHTRCTKL